MNLIHLYFKDHKFHKVLLYALLYINYYLIHLYNFPFCYSNQLFYLNKYFFSNILILSLYYFLLNTQTSSFNRVDSLFRFISINFLDINYKDIHKLTFVYYIINLPHIQHTLHQYYYIFYIEEFLYYILCNLILSHHHNSLIDINID